MVIDTSAIIAVLFGEEDFRDILGHIDADPVKLMSIASVLEASIVVDRRHGAAGLNELDTLLTHAGAEVRPVDREQLRWARFAHTTYGRGNHRAALNFGDCFSYALAKVTGQPLLFRGDDFAQTDIPSVLKS